MPPFRLALQRAPGLPPLAWIASIPLGGGTILAWHGESVEQCQEWLVEGVWDAPFEDAGFHRSESFFGTGIRVEEHQVTVSASTGMVDRLLYFVDGGRLHVSNSLILLLAASGARLHVGHDYRGDCSAPLKGLWRQPYGFRAVSAFGDAVEQLFHGNLVIRHGQVDVEMRSVLRSLESFEDYVGALRDALAGIRVNGESRARRNPVSLFATLSTGYDSLAVACLARDIGVTRCFTTRPSDSARGWVALEDGATIARALGLSPTMLTPPSVATTLDEQHYLAPTMWGSELIFHDMGRKLGEVDGVSAVFTGYHGDKVWDVWAKDQYLRDDILRGDTSGMNLSEIRLVKRFFNVAIPFLFARNIRAIVEIGRSSAMRPWQVGGSYDRPIPRRIAETAGVDRQSFGQHKRVVMSYYQHPFNPQLRDRFSAWLRHELGFSRSRMRASEVLEGVEWKLQQVVAKLRPAPGTSRFARQIGDWLLRGHDPRQLMFKWAANDLADRMAEATASHGITEVVARRG